MSTCHHRAGVFYLTKFQLKVTTYTPKRRVGVVGVKGAYNLEQFFKNRHKTLAKYVEWRFKNNF
jgi:hypothetical protein